MTNLALSEVRSRSAAVFHELSSVTNTSHSINRFSITRIPRPSKQPVCPDAACSWNDLSSVVALPKQIPSAGDVQTVGRFRILRIPLPPRPDQPAADNRLTSLNDEDDLIQF
jgi:hypothetical protein